MNYPEIIIYSVNMAEFLAPMKRKDWDDAAAYLLEKIRALKLAGADFAAISANTPHLLFEKIKADSPLHLISIVEATREEAYVILSSLLGERRNLIITEHYCFI